MESRQSSREAQPKASRQLTGEAQPKASRQLTGEAQPKASRAHIEVTTWVTRHVGGDGSGTRSFEEPLEDGDTVRTTLRRFTRRFPELDSALWSPDHSELGSHIEVIVNDAALGVTHDLDSKIEDGDRITLLGQFMGG